MERYKCFGNNNKNNNNNNNVTIIQLQAIDHNEKKTLISFIVYSLLP